MELKNVTLAWIKPFRGTTMHHISRSILIEPSIYISIYGNVLSQHIGKKMNIWIQQNKSTENEMLIKFLS